MRKINSHNNFYFFTASLVTLLLVSAYISSSLGGQYQLLLMGVMLATQLIAFFSLNLSRGWRAFVVLIVVLNVTSTLLHEFGDWRFNTRVGLCTSLAFYAGMTYTAARQVLFAGTVEINNIVGTLGVYLLLGIVWTGLYLLALEFWPEGINGIEYRDWHDNFGDTAYFSYVTMTTLGYGDMTPAVPMTRTLAYLQAVVGTFYLAVVVASLVGAFARRSG